MTKYLPRSAWNARPARHAPGRLDPPDVKGLAFHWPGATSSRPIGRRAVPRALRSWQNYHMDGHGWSDIAYQVAVDQWGRKWTLRGLESRSAANGGTIENGTYGAILLVLVQGEKPSPAMLEAVRDVVSDFRRRFPRGTQLAGHGAVRRSGPTECPGPVVRAALKAGDFEPAGTEESDVNENDVRRIVRQELEKDSGRAWRTEQLVRELVVREGLSPWQILQASRRARKAAQR